MVDFTIGNLAGHCFHGQSDLEAIFHCKSGNKKGYYHCRKRLVNRAAFDYDPTMGWMVDRWFEWPENLQNEVKND